MKTTKLPDESVDFISFVTSVDGLKAWAQGALGDFRASSLVNGGYWYPAVSTNRPAGEAIFEIAKGQMPDRGQKLRRFSQEALQSSRIRPVMPAGLEVWNAQGSAADDVLAGKGSPKAILDNYTQLVNAQLQQLGIYF
jgi:ABC-type glycerol-3-phosphate transport system substrate-binding protein